MNPTRPTKTQLREMEIRRKAAADRRTKRIEEAFKKVIAATAKQIADAVTEKLSPGRSTEVPSSEQLSLMVTTLVANYQGENPHMAMQDSVTTALSIWRFCNSKVKLLRMEESITMTTETEDQAMCALRNDPKMNDYLKAQKFVLFEVDHRLRFQEKELMSWRDSAKVIFPELSNENADVKLAEAIDKFGIPTGDSIPHFMAGMDYFHKHGIYRFRINKLLMEIAKDRAFAKKAEAIERRKQNLDSQAGVEARAIRRSQRKSRTEK